MQGKAVYTRPKVVRFFPGPCASGSYVHWAALYTLMYKCYHLYLFTLDVSYVLQIAEFVYGMLLMVAWCIH
jgi:hypothetical protein